MSATEAGGAGEGAGGAGLALDVRCGGRLSPAHNGSADAGLVLCDFPWRSSTKCTVR